MDARARRNVDADTAAPVVGRAVALARDSARVTARSMPSTPRSDDESMMNE